MKRRRGGLSPEDRDLWSRYARTAEPMHPARRVAPIPPPQAPPPPVPAAPPAIALFQVGERARARTSTRPAPPPAPLHMDAKAHRRMRAGKLRPEAKLDLHGMTLDAAHPALVRFLLRAQAEGLRLVLVVTGKGRTGAVDALWAERPGVLRRQVPIWLGLPPLSAAVLQVTEAHRSHGGAGAFYVYLRRG